MIAPNEIAARAKQKEDENYAFRTYLKGHADPEELDAQFLELHNELFANYDCNSCRNCCKEYRRNLSDEDIMKCAEKFNMPPDDFKAQYLHQNQEGLPSWRLQTCQLRRISVYGKTRSLGKSARNRKQCFRMSCAF